MLITYCRRLAPWLPGEFSQFTPAQAAKAQAKAQAAAHAELDQERLTLRRAVANLGRAYDGTAADAHDHDRTNIVRLIDRLAERPSDGQASRASRLRWPRRPS